MDEVPKKKIVSVNFIHALSFLLFARDELALQALVWFRIVRFPVIWFGVVQFGKMTSHI
jgi:hypothetical protein